jgi:cell fate regulator YaaT (PSP1 superfamily)
MQDEARVVSDKRWEVVGAIYGNAIYVKQNLAQQEANDFVRKAHMHDGTMQWTWSDGSMFSAQPCVCAVWSRLMWEPEKDAS